MSSLQNGDILFCAPSQYVMYSSEQDLQVRNTRKPWLFYSIPKMPCVDHCYLRYADQAGPAPLSMAHTSLPSFHSSPLPVWAPTVVHVVCVLSFQGRLDTQSRLGVLNSSVFFTQHQVYHVYSSIYKSGLLLLWVVHFHLGAVQFPLFCIWAQPCALPCGCEQRCIQ